MKDGALKKCCGLLKSNFNYIITMIATFLSLALIVGLTFGLFYGNAEENARTIGNITIKSEARRVNDVLMKGLNTVQMAGMAVDYMISLGMSEAEIESYLTEETERTKNEIDENFSGIYGVVNDIYIDGTGWEPDGNYNAYLRPWYTAAEQNNGAPTIVSPYIDAQTGHRMISFSQILTDGKNALSLDMEIDDIYNAMDEIRLMGNGYCFVVDDEGLIVSHSDSSEKDKNYFSDASDYHELMENVISENDSVTEVTLNGEKCYAFSEKTLDNWHIVLVVKSFDLFRKTNVNLAVYLMISFAIFMLVGYFCTSNYINKKRAIKYAGEVKTDKLTGLNNRGEFDRYIAFATKIIPEGKKIYLTLFDADGFKGINDAFGHVEGDKALQYIAEALKSVAEETGSFCARYGGDEFVMVSTFSCEGEAIQTIGKINKRLDDVSERNKLPYKLSLSAGFSAYDGKIHNMTELVDDADLALYEVKRSRRAAGATENKI